MQYVRYLKTYGSKTKGDIEEQPDIVAYTLLDKGLAENSFPPAEQAEIDALAAEQDAIDRGEEVGLISSPVAVAELGEADETPEPTPPTAPAKKKRSRVRRATLEHDDAQKATLSDDDLAAQNEEANDED
jgi:hypothetical protein